MKPMSCNSLPATRDPILVYLISLPIDGTNPQSLIAFPTVSLHSRYSGPDPCAMDTRLSPLRFVPSPAKTPSRYAHFSSKTSSDGPKFISFVNGLHLTVFLQLLENVTCFMSDKSAYGRRSPGFISFALTSLPLSRRNLWSSLQTTTPLFVTTTFLSAFLRITPKFDGEYLFPSYIFTVSIGRCTSTAIFGTKDPIVFNPPSVKTNVLSAKHFAFGLSHLHASPVSL